MIENPPAVDPAPSPKGPVIFYICSGIALGLLLFRFGFMPFGWKSFLAKIFEIGPPVLIFSSWQIAKQQKQTGWSFKEFALFWLPSLLVTLGISWLLLAINPAQATLIRRDLPGFSLDLPEATIAQENLDYANGRFDLKDIAGSPLALNIAWEPGGALDDEAMQIAIEMLSAAMQGKLSRPVEYWPGPQGAQVPSLVVATPRGSAYLSLLLCGGRRISLISFGYSDAEALQKRILLTLDCHPDQQQEATLNSIPWTIKSAAWKKLPDSPAGQVQFSNGESVIIARSLTGIQGDREYFKGVMKALFSNDTIALNFGEWAGDYLKLSGTVQGNAAVGWVRRFSCGKTKVLVMALAPDEPAAQRLMQVCNQNGACLPPG